MTTQFDTWLAKQFDDGLADIKFAVVAGKGVSAEAIQNELLVAEAALSAGYHRSAPKATSMLRDEIAAFVAKH